MYRKVKCKFAPFHDVKEKVVVSTHQIIDGEEKIVVDYVEKDMKERSVNALNPRVVNVSSLIESGQTIQGSVNAGLSDPSDLDQFAGNIANKVVDNISKIQE